MKFAFDVHGVLDSLVEYRDLMRHLHAGGHEIYIISGQPLDEEMKKFLFTSELVHCYDNYYSIESYLLEQGVHPFEERQAGKFWSDEIWDPVKAQICKDEGIDMIFDDSPTYAESFKNVATHYNLVIDKTKNLTDGRVNPRSCVTAFDDAFD